MPSPTDCTTSRRRPGARKSSERSPPCWRAVRPSTRTRGPRAPPRGSSAGDSVPASDLGRMKAYLERVQAAVGTGNDAGLQVDAPGNGRAVLLVNGAVTALRQDVQHHLDRGRVFEEGAVRLDDAPTGQGVPHDDRDDVRLDEGGDLFEQRRGGVLVGVEAAHELLPRVKRHL